MKFYITLLNILIISSIYISCENHENEDQLELFENWSLVAISGGFSMPEHFNIGDIIWDFKSNNTINIKLNVELPDYSRIPFKSDSEYEYEHKNGWLIINNDIDYRYNIDEEILILSNEDASDGGDTIIFYKF